MSKSLTKKNGNIDGKRVFINTFKASNISVVIIFGVVNSDKNMTTISSSNNLFFIIHQLFDIIKHKGLMLCLVSFMKK